MSDLTPFRCWGVEDLLPPHMPATYMLHTAGVASYLPHRYVTAARLKDIRIDAGQFVRQIPHVANHTSPVVTEPMMEGTVRALSELDALAPWMRVYAVLPMPGAAPFHPKRLTRAAGFLQIVISEPCLARARSEEGGVAPMEREWHAMTRAWYTRGIFALGTPLLRYGTDPDVAARNLMRVVSLALPMGDQGVALGVPHWPTLHTDGAGVPPEAGAASAARPEGMLLRPERPPRTATSLSRSVTRALVDFRVLRATRWTDLVAACRRVLGMYRCTVVAHGWNVDQWEAQLGPEACIVIRSAEDWLGTARDTVQTGMRDDDAAGDPGCVRAACTRRTVVIDVDALLDSRMRRHTELFEALACDHAPNLLNLRQKDVANCETRLREIAEELFGDDEIVGNLPRVSQLPREFVARGVAQARPYLRVPVMPHVRPDLAAVFVETGVDDEVFSVLRGRTPAPVFLLESARDWRSQRAPLSVFQSTEDQLRHRLDRTVITKWGATRESREEDGQDIAKVLADAVTLASCDRSRLALKGEVAAGVALAELKKSHSVTLSLRDGELDGVSLELEMSSGLPPLRMPENAEFAPGTHTTHLVLAADSGMDSSSEEEEEGGDEGEGENVVTEGGGGEGEGGGVTSTPAPAVSLVTALIGERIVGVVEAVEVAAVPHAVEGVAAVEVEGVADGFLSGERIAAEGEVAVEGVADGALSGERIAVEGEAAVEGEVVVEGVERAEPREPEETTAAETDASTSSDDDSDAQSDSTESSEDEDAGDDEAMEEGLRLHHAQSTHDQHTLLRGARLLRRLRALPAAASGIRIAGSAGAAGAAGDATDTEDEWWAEDAAVARRDLRGSLASWCIHEAPACLAEYYAAETWLETGQVNSAVPTWHAGLLASGALRVTRHSDVGTLIDKVCRAAGGEGPAFESKKTQLSYLFGKVSSLFLHECVTSGVLRRDEPRMLSVAQERVQQMDRQGGAASRADPVIERALREEESSLHMLSDEFLSCLNAGELNSILLTVEQQLLDVRKKCEARHRQSATMEAAARDNLLNDVCPLGCDNALDTFLECGHTLCFDCFSQLRPNPVLRCPFCRTQVKAAHSVKRPDDSFAVVQERAVQLQRELLHCHDDAANYGGGGDGSGDSGRTRCGAEAAGGFLLVWDEAHEQVSDVMRQNGATLLEPRWAKEIQHKFFSAAGTTGDSGGAKAAAGVPNFTVYMDHLHLVSERMRFSHVLMAVRRLTLDVARDLLRLDISHGTVEVLFYDDASFKTTDQNMRALLHPSLVPTRFRVPSISVDDPPLG